jgi:hypothetical protein
VLLEPAAGLLGAGVGGRDMDGTLRRCHVASTRSTLARSAGVNRRR